MAGARDPKYTTLLQTLRESRGMSRKKLADAAGLSEQSISYYEAGRYGRSTRARAMADALGYDGPLDDLFRSPSAIERRRLVAERMNRANRPPSVLHMEIERHKPKLVARQSTFLSNSVHELYTSAQSMTEYYDHWFRKLPGRAEGDYEVSFLGFFPDHRKAIDYWKSWVRTHA